MSKPPDASPPVLQAVDSAPQAAAHARRRHWLRLLARAPLPRLEEALAGMVPARVAWLRSPETGLMMVRGRIGGTGDRFNLGELTVTRCALRVVNDDGAVAAGVGYVLGRSARLAELVALADALLQDPAHGARLQRDPSLRAPVARMPSTGCGSKGLSPASKASLELQGGVLAPNELERFIDHPFAGNAVRLRRYDDAAKVPRQRTPGLPHFVAVLMREVAPDSRTGISYGQQYRRLASGGEIRHN